VGDGVTVRVEVAPDPATVAAAHIAVALHEMVAAQGTATLALSGGGTPLPMFVDLARSSVPWADVDVLQVDERVAPPGSPDRNLTAIRAALGPPLPTRLHALPVDDVDLDAAAARASADLVALAGDPPVLDVVHLGVGDDGHTASLAPGDALAEAEGPDVPAVAVVRAFRGHDRLTLTLPVLVRARVVVWLVAGAGKAHVVAGLRAGDASTPAGRVAALRARAGPDADLLICDPEAAG
jgi:6-phosphogluconolactonase